MSKTEASSSPDVGAPFDAQRTHVEEPTQLAPPHEQATRPAAGKRELDDNWALSASLAVPRVTGITDAAPDPEGPTVPSSGPDAAADALGDAPVDAPVLSPAAAPRQALSRAALRLLGGKTMQGVGPALGQRRPAGADEGDVGGQGQVSASSLQAADQHVQFSRGGAHAPMYLDEPEGRLRLSTDTSEVSVPEIDAGTSATMMLPGKRAPSPYARRDDGAALAEEPADPDDDDDVGELAEPPLPDPAHSLGHDPHDDSGAHDPHDDSDAHPHDDSLHRGRSMALAGVPVSASLKAPTAVTPAIALAGARRPYANDLVGESGHRAEADWFEPSGGVPMADSMHPAHTARQLDPSLAVPARGRPRKGNATGGRYTLPLLVFAAVSAVVFAGAYVYSRGRAPATQVSTPMSPETALAPETPAAPTEPGVATAPATDSSAAGLVDIRFDSNPPGATVVLVDRERSNSSVVGTTPVRAAIDPRASYDAIFTLEGHPTRMLPVSASSPHLVADFTLADPAVAVAAGTPDAAVPDAASAQPATGDPKLGKDPEATTTASKPDKRDGGKRPIKRPRNTKADPDAEDEDEPTIPAVDPSAIGRLTVSTKPPCQILINGKAHGTTPLREVPLPAGIYRLTLVNKDIAINETVAVRVTAGKETKVTQDYTGEP